MRRMLHFAGIILFLAGGLAAAQDGPGGAFAGQVPVKAALKKGFSSKDVKVGQEIAATTEQPVTIGTVTLPKGSLLLGHVVHATPHSSANPNGSVTIVFDHAQPKKADAVPIRASVYRIALSDDQMLARRSDLDVGMRGTAAEVNGTGLLRQNTDADDRRVTGSVSASGAPVKVVSAVPGVLLSAVAGSDKSAIMTTKNHDVELGAGMEMVVGVALQ